MRDKTRTVFHKMCFYVGLIGSIIVIKSVLFCMLYKSGFTVTGADEYSRTLKAFYWMKNPRLIFEGIWLPFGYYLEGTVLYFWRNLFLAPKVTTLVASILAITGLYFLSLALFESRKAGILAVCLAIFHPLVNWYSYTPLVCMYHVASVLWALTFFAFWLRTHRFGFLFLASATFFVSSGFRYESWFFIGPYSAYVFFLSCKNLKNNIKRAFLYALAASIPLLFPAMWILVSLFREGRFLDAHNLRGEYLNQNKAFHDVDASFIYKFMEFPREFVGNNFIVMTVLILFSIALLFLLWKLKPAIIKHKVVILFHLGFVVFAFLVLCFYVGFTAPPLGASRIIILYFMCLIPFVAWVFSFVFDSDILSWRKSVIYVFRLAVVMFLLFFSIFQIKAMYDYPKNVLANETMLGFDLKDILTKHPLGPGEKVMVQLHYWGYRGVVVGSSNPEMFIFDGPVNPLENHAKKLSAIKEYHKSVFELNREEIVQYLKQNNVKYVALRGTYLIQKLRHAIGVKALSCRGQWCLFEVEM